MLKPKVDAFFKWVKESLPKVPGDSATARAFRYCLNQETYLRVFLSDPHVPLHNNAAEQAIRPFTLGRKNWVNMYSTRGAQASAVIYSLVETAKANNLNVYEYLDDLLTQLSAHAEDTDLPFLEICSHGLSKVRWISDISALFLKSDSRCFTPYFYSSFQSISLILLFVHIN